jgi:hypothetical protein
MSRSGTYYTVRLTPPPQGFRPLAAYRDFQKRQYEERQNQQAMHETKLPCENNICERMEPVWARQGGGSCENCELKRRGKLKFVF